MSPTTSDAGWQRRGSEPRSSQSEGRGPLTKLPRSVPGRGGAECAFAPIKFRVPGYAVMIRARPHTDRMTPTGLPDTLHGQLYLLCTDRRRGRLDHSDPRLLGMALRAAMLTDLYLNGHVQDSQGMPRPCDTTLPNDPVLKAMLDELIRGKYSSWARAISPEPDRAIRTVRYQLEADGWIIPRRTIRGFTASRISLHDDAVVESLADCVTRAVHNAVAGLPADPLPLAVGLLGILGQLPTVFSFSEASQCRGRLRDLIAATIEPILGLQEAVLWNLKRTRNEIGFVS